MHAACGDSGLPERPPLVATIGATAAIGVLVAATLWSVTRTGWGALVALDLAVALAAVAGVAWVVRHPVVAGLASGLLAAFSVVATPVASFAVLFTARQRPFRQAAVVAAVGVVGQAVQGLWRPMPGLPYGWWLAMMTAAYAALLGWGTWARARQALLSAWRDRARRAEQDQAQRVVQARAAERARIAREMHDVLAHRLSLLAAYAGALEYRPDSPPERLAQAASVIRSSAHQALQEMREVISLLRHDDADELEADGPPGPTLADVPRLVDEARAAGQHIDVEDRIGLPVTTPPLVGRTAYRVVQEALTNARKHAEGQPVVLTLAGAPGSHLTVAVHNPTAPATPVPVGAAAPSTGTAGLGGGMGLLGLAERVALVGGHVEYATDRSGQFRLDARLPWPT